MLPEVLVEHRKFRYGYRKFRQNQNPKPKIVYLEQMRSKCNQNLQGPSWDAQEPFPKRSIEKAHELKANQKKLETGGKGTQEHENLDPWLHVKSGSLALGQKYSFTFQQANNIKICTKRAKTRFAIALDPQNQEITQKWI